MMEIEAAFGHWICSPVSHADNYLQWDDELIRTEYQRVIDTAFPDSPALIDFHVVKINRSATSMKTGSQRLRPNPLDAGGELFWVVIGSISIGPQV